FASLSRPQFFLPSPRDPPPLHSFPTRRSSDLTRADRPAEAPPPRHLAFRNLAIDVDKRQVVAHGHPVDLTRQEFDLLQLLASRRSEEHTSELQSPCNLVCRLPLEKKKHSPLSS